MVKVQLYSRKRHSYNLVQVKTVGNFIFTIFITYFSDYIKNYSYVFLGFWLPVTC